MRDLIFECTECGWRGNESEMSVAPHPFVEGDTISGCPKCGTIGEWQNMCDEPGCDQPASCGWPHPDGYRRTCYEHSKDFRP